MDRCWLSGLLGDALHAGLCAAGYNIRWLLRAMAHVGFSALPFYCPGISGDSCRNSAPEFFQTTSSGEEFLVRHDCRTLK